MPAIQTTYSEHIAEAVAGAPGTMIPSTNLSRNVENAAGIAFGKAAFRGTDDRGCHLATTGDTAANFLGITIVDRSAIGPGALGGNGFGQYESAKVRTKGHVWVIVGEDVADGDPALVTVADATFKKTVAAGNVAINGVYDTTALSGGLALVRLI